MSFNVYTTVSGPSPGQMDQMLQQIARKTLAELFGRYQASFNPTAWNWPRVTQRRNGTVVSSPRNIVDIGTLRQSGTYRFLDPFTMEARWSVGYSTAVHEGARLRNGTILGAKGGQQRITTKAALFALPQQRRPARPWTYAVNGTVQASGIPPFPLGEKLRQRILLAVARS